MSMSGQPWLGAAASFLAMWVVMMVAMMLPSLVPTLWRYRQAGLGPLTALVAVGLLRRLDGVRMAAYPLGVALAAVEMQHPALARAVPIAVGVVVLIAGSLQLTAWKRVTSPTAGRHQGAAVRCRPTPARPGDTACASASTAATAVSV